MVDAENGRISQCVYDEYRGIKRGYKKKGEIL